MIFNWNCIADNVHTYDIGALTEPGAKRTAGRSLRRGTRGRAESSNDGDQVIFL